MKLRFESNRNINITNVKIELPVHNEPRISIDININGEWYNKVILLVKSNSGAYFTNHIRRIYRDGVDKKVSNVFRMSDTKEEFKSIKLKNKLQKNIHNNY